ASAGRFEAVQLTASGAVIELDVAGVAVREWMTTVPTEDGTAAFVRHVEIGPSSSTHWLVLGTTAAGIDVSLAADDARSVTLEQQRAEPGSPAVHVVRVAPSAGPRQFAVALAPAGIRPQIEATPLPRAPARARWPETITTPIGMSADTDAPYVIDDVPLPVDNPWRRNVRASDIQFLGDGTGVVVTLDGDVWLARGLAGGDGNVR